MSARPTEVTTGSWRELLARDRLGTVTVLAGGVALYATNEFLTISLLPSAVFKSGTSWLVVANTIWHGATTDMPRPPQAALTNTDPVCATRASARLMVACAVSRG